MIPNVVYVGLGQDLHVGGVAEWAYRVGYYLKEHGINFEVITNADIPNYSRGTYAVHKVSCAGSSVSIGNFYLNNFLACAHNNIEHLGKVLHKLPLIITADPLTALAIKALVRVKPCIYTHTHELIYGVKTNVISDPDLIDVLRYAMSKAIVVTQTENNRQELLKYNIDAHVWTIPVAPEYYKLKPMPEDYIIYTAGFDKFKNPEALIKVAEKLREFKFVVVGGRALWKASSVPNNVVLIGNLSREEYYKMLSRAYMSIHFSLVEALSISTMDNGWFHPTLLPLNRGWTRYWEPMPKFKNLQEAVELIKRFYSSDTLYSEVLEKQRAFIHSNHSPTVFVEQFKKLSNYYLSQVREVKEFERTRQKILKCLDSPNILECLGWRDPFIAYKTLLKYAEKLRTSTEGGWW